MPRFHRVHKNRRIAHAGQGGGDLFADITGFADTGQDDFTPGIDGGGAPVSEKFKLRAQFVAQYGNTFQFDIKYLAGDLQCAAFAVHITDPLLIMPYRRQALISIMMMPLPPSW